MALLAVPVFARFAKVSKEAIVHYHLVGLGGLFMLVGEATRITADKIPMIAFLVPTLDVVTAILGYAGVVFGTVWLALHYIRHPKEI